MEASTAEILIVEDDEVIMGTLAYNLSRQGFDVKGAATGAEALGLARKTCRAASRLAPFGSSAADA